MKKILNSVLPFFATVAILFASSCSKSEGKGGAATITGKVMIQDLTSGGALNGSPYNGFNVKVYLIYGNASTYSDSYSTSYDGSYIFTGLKKGTYKVFVYSSIYPVPATAPKEKSLLKEVILTDKKGTVEVETFNIYK